MVCRVSGMDRASLATVLGKTSIPPKEALLVTPTWVGPSQVCCCGNELKRCNLVT